jgi:hypothetical protein
MKPGPIPGVNIAHNTASRGYRGGELDDDSTPVSWPLNIAHNTLPQVFARLGLLPPLAASVDPTDARKATVRRIGRSDRRAQGDRPTHRSIRPKKFRAKHQTRSHLAV